jgi:mannose-6-phosphate isomerase-like protein (cupin superfamily)
MRQIEIRDIDAMPIAGVTVVTERNFDPYVEGNFVWKATPLVASFSTSRVSGGILRATKRPPVFTEVETHVDDEAFYFVSGVALMAFADVDEGRVVEDSIQIARIRPDTQFIIAAGKAHFVPVAEGDEPVTAVVVSPKMDAPRLPLAEPVAGI